MAFLSHAIPWHSVSCMLEYRAARSGPGRQDAHIAWRAEPSSVHKIKQLEYFAKRFEDTLREHVAIERRRYQPVEVYTARARGWTTSDPVPDGPATILDANVVTSSLNSNDEKRIRRNHELRRMQATLNANGGTWPHSTETRSVYSDDFVETWSTSRKCMKYLTMPFLRNNVGRTIQDWTEFCTAFPDCNPTQLYHDSHELCVKEFSLGNVIKLLVADAAMTTQANRREHNIETLLLLARHPQIKLEKFNWQSLCCCNRSFGFQNFARLVLKIFVLLNVMASLQDLGFADIGRPKVDPEEELKSYKPAWNCEPIPCWPRPIYLNLQVWKSLVTEVRGSHQEMAETIFFNKLLFKTRSDDDMYVEIDFLSDRAILQQQLKVMWRIFLVTDMILGEVGQTERWELKVLETLATLLKWPSGERFLEYEDRRRGRVWGARPDGSFGWYYTSP